MLPFLILIHILDTENRIDTGFLIVIDTSEADRLYEFLERFGVNDILIGFIRSKASNLTWRERTLESFMSSPSREWLEVIWIATLIIRIPIVSLPNISCSHYCDRGVLLDCRSPRYYSWLEYHS